MTLKGGKSNKALKDWVSFVKEVQKKNNLNYKDAIMEAKRLKDKGVNWRKSSSMKGGDDNEVPVPEVEEVQEVPEVQEVSEVPEVQEVSEVPEVSEVSEVSEVEEEDNKMSGGKRRTRKHRKMKTKRHTKRHSRHNKKKRYSRRH